MGLLNFLIPNKNMNTEKIEPNIDLEKPIKIIGIYPNGIMHWTIFNHQYLGVCPEDMLYSIHPDNDFITADANIGTERVYGAKFYDFRHHLMVYLLKHFNSELPVEWPDGKKTYNSNNIDFNKCVCWIRDECINIPLSEQSYDEVIKE